MFKLKFKFRLGRVLILNSGTGSLQWQALPVLSGLLSVTGSVAVTAQCLTPLSRRAAALAATSNSTSMRDNPLGVFQPEAACH